MAPAGRDALALLKAGGAGFRPRRRPHEVGLGCPRAREAQRRLGSHPALPPPSPPFERRRRHARRHFSQRAIFSREAPPQSIFLRHLGQTGRLAQAARHARAWAASKPVVRASHLARAAPENFRGRASQRSSCLSQAQLSQHGTAARAHLLGAYDCERGTGEGSVERRQAARRDGVQVWVRVRVIQGKRACGRAGGRVQKQQQQQGLLWCVALAWLWLRVGVGVGRGGRRSASASTLLSTWEGSRVRPRLRSPNPHG